MRFNLSEITALIKHRRSVKPEDYSSRKVQRDMVENILNNAIWAPSHGLTQPWRFKVFMDGGLDKLKAFLPELYKATTPAELFNPKKQEKLQLRPSQSSVIIAVCMEREAAERIPEIEEIQAVACAVQNMYLTCTAYGIGGFWSSPKFIYTPEMNAFLGLGEKDKCLGLFYMGYPAGEWPKSHRKPLEYVSEWITE